MSRLTSRASYLRRTLPGLLGLAVLGLGSSGCGSSSDLFLTEDSDALRAACSARFYRLYNGSLADHFYTADVNEMNLAQSQYGYVLEDEEIYVCTSQVSRRAVPLYRYYGAEAKDHFYTTRGNGRAIDGYAFEGIAAYVFTTQGSIRTRLYRHYSSSAGDHFYTTLSASVPNYELEDEEIFVYAPDSTLAHPPVGLPGSGQDTDPPSSSSDAGTPDSGGAPVSPLPPPVDPYPSVRFVHKFGPDGRGVDAQCNGAFSGTEEVVFGEWSQAIRIDTDNRAGGCIQQFGLVDPLGGLAGLRLHVNFYADGDAGQCGSPGDREVPIVSAGATLYTSEYRIDSDNRYGGCVQVFSLEGRDDLALDVRWEADGDATQCGNAGTHSAFTGSPVQIRLDTDGRWGGCRQSFRLRKR